MLPFGKQQDFRTFFRRHIRRGVGKPPGHCSFALSYIRRDGKGRVFYEGHGHSDRVYAMTPMLEHLRAGIQYALNGLKADDSPSVK
jgi:type 1 glutamine amidotransferase